MQHYFMTIKANNDKVIKNMEVGQICLQNKLLTMEENHSKEVSAMKDEHSTHMDAITIHVQKFQHQSEDERNKETSKDHKPPCLLQQAPSYYEEVICSIVKSLIEGDPDKMEINKNQVDAYMFYPPVIKDKVITHDTCETNPSLLTKQM